jgi:hypothetical protein
MFEMIRKRRILTSLIVCLMALFACRGGDAEMSVLSDNHTSAVSRISDRDWQDIIRGAGTVGRRVEWRIKITDVSGFGGFYVKGYLVESPDARVHLTWPPGHGPRAEDRKFLSVGGIVTVTGDVEGVTLDHEVMLGVVKILH